MRPAVCLASLVVLVVVCSSSRAAARTQDDETRTIQNHRLTLPLVKQAVAVDRDLIALVKSDPSLEQKMGARTSSGIEASAKAMDAMPEVAGVLAKTGITSRDYLLTTLAMMATAMTHEFMAAGKMPPLPPGFPTHNLDFWKANAAELQPVLDEWKKGRTELQKGSRR